MSGNYEAILEAAQSLPAEQQRQLAEQLLASMEQTEPPASARGKARRHFGVWDSGDERSADNKRIDRDLAQWYGDSPRP